ncbi:MAG: helix-turn-helix domain-containing protein [Gemmatimonadota bacterium]
METTKLLRAPEVASLLRVPLPRVYELARSGNLPVVHLGRQIRVHPDELDKWMRKGGRPLAADRSARPA